MKKGITPVKNYINLYDYFNYRDFLADYYVAAKDRDKNFSYRYFAMKAGYNSSGLYSSIVQSKVCLKMVGCLNL